MPKRIKWDRNGRDGKWVDGPDRVLDEGETLRVPLFLQDSKRTQLRDTFRLDDAGLDHFRPGYRMLGDKARETVRNARQEMIDNATNAWRMDGRKRKPPDDDEDEDNYDEDENGTGDRHPKKADDAGCYQAADRDARQYGSDRLRDDIRRRSIEARAAWIRALGDAWKRPGGYQPTPDPFQRTYGQKRPIEPRSVSNGGRPMADATPDDIQARRDAAWNSYKDQLSNAWRSPAGRADPNRAAGVEAERQALTFETRGGSVPSPGNDA
jgi:hypothetical protein